MELDLKRETTQGVQSLKNDLNRLNIEHKKLASETKEELKHYSLT
jgi:hypothetical protein